MSSGQAGLAEYFHANKAMFWCKPQLKGKYFCECCRFRSKESLSIGLCLDVEEAIFTELQNATVVVPNLCALQRDGWHLLEVSIQLGHCQESEEHQT